MNDVGGCGSDGRSADFSNPGFFASAVGYLLSRFQSVYFYFSSIRADVKRKMFAKAMKIKIIRKQALPD